MDHPDLDETTRPGRGTRLRRLRVEECASLALHHLAHVGVGEAGSEFCMVRTRLPGAFLIGTVQGAGWVRLDGRWVQCRKGMACLSPPHVLQACHGTRGTRWKFVWCRWQPNSTPAPLIHPNAPLLREFDADSLHGIVAALHAETASHAHPTVVHHLLCALSAAVWNFTGAFDADRRLARLWSAVEAKPAENWTLDRMASLAGCSCEHLRRLCVEEIGRPPSQQLAWIRLRHATRLLSTTNEKVETIALASGYSSAFSLSDAFRRWMNCRPSDLRPAS